jgi:hypothetical protein
MTETSITGLAGTGILPRSLIIIPENAPHLLDKIKKCWIGLGYDGSQNSFGYGGIGIFTVGN